MQKVRSIFLSDIHLGTRACQAGQLLAFLRAYESEYIFLIGDIIDLWAMSRSVYWPQSHNTVIQKLLRRARHGDKIFLIPGNHDEALREYIGLSFGNIHIVEHYLHETSSGKRYMLIHGDEFDQVTRYHRWIAVLGDVAYETLVRLNIILSRIRRLLRRPGYWSLAGFAKRKIKQALTYIQDFEGAVIRDIRHKGLDGVICGHIHVATINCHEDAYYYINCGDWVDSCTAIVEHMDGRMELIEWNSQADHDLDDHALMTNPLMA
ncbi:MAG TPA: UDP-2,3-diacylglucosamine diphosphatase [Burkholderiales bacterium]|nr:UDP-2,3-diacylglucosamine diphosphatase [Burkholderiales bacterium]